MNQISNASLPPWARILGFRVLRRGKFLLGHDPLFLPIFLRLTPLGTSRKITDATELVVEGFPRSGNTFTVFALQDAAGGRLRLVSHVHHPSQVKLAVERGKPTILVIREPVAALSSYLAYGPHGRPASVLKEYTSYHRELIPYLDQVTICDFTEVTTDLSSVILRVNERFGTAIPPFNQTTQNVEQVFDDIARQHQLLHRGLDPDFVAPRPSGARHEVSRRARAQLLDPEHHRLLDQAVDLYEYFLAKSGQQRSVFKSRVSNDHGPQKPKRESTQKLTARSSTEGALPTR